MRDVNLQVWFGERELTHVPPHFVKATTPLTSESLHWINSKLTGRYTISTYTDDTNFIIDLSKSVYFEDPGEAMMYELRWAGSK
jgi:hypothetical protein